MRAFILLLILAAAGCGPNTEEPRSLTVAVSILPQAELVGAIGAGRWDVVTAVAPGQSPATFDPSPRHMKDLAAARAYFACGAPMENQLLPRLKSSYPELEIIDTVAGQARLPLPGHTHTDGHDHGEELDPHLWLDPNLLADQAVRIAEALSRLDPAGRGGYLARSDSLRSALAELDGEIREILAPVKGREIFVYHPAYGYFARAYGLTQVAVEQGGIDPSPRALAAVLEKIAERGARSLLVQPQFSLGSARRIAHDTGVEIVILDPLASPYAENLRRMAHAILEALDER